MTRQQLSDMITAILDRIATSEALSESRFDRWEQQMDQTERSIEEHLGPIERLLEAILKLRPDPG